ncbi:uncharacterized protein FIESC28_00791 [Fusarium coffeatum]|uniref:Uncharacterized protein n=1 Tax=Fusarium coffeatum TaxID=231269 RepID=A0A366SCJ9_9HYPO|nr:uncharacterized protein FIESC28_00791 [Fusarium coffeatum]RBR26386.1 hypothetical protein FIESC28_00791 [Fusarium coffeatum]
MSATTDKVYDRWLKDAEPWLQEDDWNSDEYFKWVERLAQAKATLDERYIEVDKNVLQKVYSKAASHEKTVLQNRPNGDFGRVKSWDVAYLIMRQIIAYHFFNRATFEEIPEKSLVKRVQVHLVKMNIPMLDTDIAQMLQAAADKVPLQQAIERALRNYIQKIRKSEPVSTAYNRKSLGWDNPLFIKKLQQTRVNGGPADRSKIPQFFKEVNEDRVAREYKPFEDDVLKNIEAAFNTDEKMALFMERCAEPFVENESSDRHAATAIEYVLDSPDFKWLMDYAAAAEKENLSWEATIGPAVKALKRLGRTSAGKDFDKLAAYAKAHQKPQTV